MRKRRRFVLLLGTLALVLTLTGTALAIDFGDPGVDVEVTDDQAGQLSQFTIVIYLNEELTEGDEDLVWIKFPDEVNITNDTPATTDVLMENTGIVVGPGADNPKAVEYGYFENGPGAMPADNVYTLTVPSEGLHTGEPTTITFYTSAGIRQPMEEGNFCVAVKTSDEMWRTGESIPGGCWDVTGQPVTLYLKRQVPQAQCGFTQLDPIATFNDIQGAVDAAARIWDGLPLLETGDYWPRWNLFEGCPSDVLAASNTDTDRDYRVMPTGVLHGSGVYVGAVIAVEADFDDNDMADVFTETLDIQIPGLTLGSKPNTAGTVENAVIQYGFPGEAYTDIGAKQAGVAIKAGGVSFGESSIAISTDAFGVPSDTFELRGFDLMGWYTNTSAIVVSPTAGMKCVAGVHVYSSTDMVSGTLIAGDIEGTTFSGDFITNNGITANDKVVNLDTGWSVYYDGSVFTLTLPTAGAGTFDVNEYFAEGENYAVFDEISKYECFDARVDIRDNEIHGADLNGIAVYEAAIWVDGNEVYDNGNDGLYLEDLKGCDSVMICDGGGRRLESQLLEISNNQLHDNGALVSTWWTDTSVCFNPEARGGNDSGIDIMSTAYDCGINPFEPEDRLYIHDNLIQANTDAGIWLETDAAATGIRILWNEILDNGAFGLSNEATGDTGYLDGLPAYTEPAGVNEVDVIFRYNEVNGNPAWGVKNWAEGANGVWFNAKENYWNMCENGGGGEKSPLQTCDPPGGPTAGPMACAHMYNQQSEAMGNGDSVSKGVFYNPWLTEQAIEEWDWDMFEHIKPMRICGDADICRYQDMRVYGSDTMWLQKGWNTLAVPLPLDAGYNLLEDIRTLGTFLEDAEGNPKYEVAYQYNNTTGSWDPIIESVIGQDEILAVHGYFIKMAEASRFPVIYGKTMMDLPYYDLKASDGVPMGPDGWNLVGAAYGIDRENNQLGLEETTPNDQGRFAVANPDDPYDPESNMPAYIAFESINKAASTIINPGVAGQFDPFWVGAYLNIGGRMTHVGEAYWVYMKADATLAGFEMAPLFFRDEIPLW